MPGFDSDEFISFAKELAHESGHLIKSYFGNPELEIDVKADHTPVTVADREAEALMRKLIKHRYPHHGVIGEEGGEENQDAEFVWVLDPIDGTKSFAANCPLFGTLICLMQNGEPVLGAIHNPVTNQLLIGDNHETTLNGNAVHVSETNDLHEATLLTTALESPVRYQKGGNWLSLTRKIKILRTWGDCFGYLLVAQGKADIMVDPIMGFWDMMALIPVIRGAGGIISDWQGNNPVKGTSMVASNPYLHEKVIRLLND